MKIHRITHTAVDIHSRDRSHDVSSLARGKLTVFANNTQLPSRISRRAPRLPKLTHLQIPIKSLYPLKWPTVQGGAWHVMLQELFGIAARVEGRWRAMNGPRSRPDETASKDCFDNPIGATTPERNRTYRWAHCSTHRRPGPPRVDAQDVSKSNYQTWVARLKAYLGLKVILVRDRGVGWRVCGGKIRHAVHITQGWEGCNCEVCYLDGPDEGSGVQGYT